jgi:hypothetical protein
MKVFYFSPETSDEPLLGLKLNCYTSEHAGIVISAVMNIQSPKYLLSFSMYIGEYRQL